MHDLYICQPMAIHTTGVHVRYTNFSYYDMKFSIMIHDVLYHILHITKFHTFICNKYTKVFPSKHYQFDLAMEGIHRSNIL